MKTEQLKLKYDDNYYDNGWIGSSALACITNDVPAVYKQKFIDDIKETRKVFTVGDAFHALVLEKERFDKDYAVLPETIKRKSGSKWTEFQNQNKGKHVFSIADKQKLDKMADSFNLNPDVNALLANTIDVEIPVKWDKYIKQRAKIDALVQYGGTLCAVDVKTTKSAKPIDFQKSIFNYCYDIQAAHYIEGFKEHDIYIDNWFFILIEKTEPYLTAVYQLSTDFINIGAERRKLAIQKIIDCSKTGIWKGYEMKVIEPPTWININ